MKTEINYRGKNRVVAQVGDRTFSMQLAKAIYYLVATVPTPGTYFVCNGNLRPTGEYFALQGNQFVEVVTA